VGLRNECYPDEDYPFLSSLAREEFCDEQKLLEYLTAKETIENAIPELENRTIPELQRVNNALASRLKKYEEVGLRVEGLRGQTTADRLTILAKVGAGRPAAPPPEPTADADVAVRVHQTVINHVLERVLAGKTFVGDKSEDEILRLLLTPEKPPAPPVGTARATFTVSNPVKLVLGRDSLDLTLRFTNFVVGKQVFDNIRVEASFPILRSADEKVVSMPKKIDVFPLEAGGPVPEDVGRLTNFLNSRFLATALRVLSFGEIPLPGVAAGTAPMTLQSFDVGDGWLSLAWQRKKPE